MLLRHPITQILYDHGYNGIDNMYEYWNENKHEIVHLYSSYYPNRNQDIDVFEFETKVRWTSMFGIYVRMDINYDLYMLEYIQTNLSNIKVRLGDNKLSIEDFSKATLKGRSTSKTDLRGLSIIKQTANHITLKDIDFTYASIESCDFTDVHFQNCIFHKTSFMDTKLMKCTFDSSCIMEYNDFQNTLLDCTFDCSIDSPRIKPMPPLLFLSQSRLDYFLKYPPFTIMLNDSFPNHTNSDEIWAQYQKQDTLRTQLQPK